MEDVTPIRRLSGDDRGQLILVTGLAIAVILVALVLLLNTVIYTENLATRGADVGGRDAVEFRAVAATGTGQVIDSENDADHSSPEVATENASYGIRRYADLLERGYLERSTVAEISNLSLAEGMTLRHENTTRTFVSADGDQNWTLATNVGENDLRRFRFDLSRDQLASSPSQAFRIVADDGDDVRRVFVYRQGSEVVVATNTAAGGSPTPVCSVTAARTTFSLTAGTLGDKSCSLDFAGEPDDEYSVAYRYGNRANGTYSVAVNTSGSANVNVPDFEPDSSASPYISHAVYSATFDLHYQTARLTYAERIRVAPGESDE